MVAMVTSMPSATASQSGDKLRILDPVDIPSQPHPIHHPFEMPTHAYANIVIRSGAD